MERKLWRNLMVVVAVATLLMLVREGRAQQRQDRSCINKLLPCLSYLNGTRNPPDSCCDPLKEVIKSDPECLCRMASNDGTKQAENAGINVNEAQQLPGSCGQNVNPISCLKSGATPNSRNSVPNGSFSCSTPNSSTTTMIMVVVGLLGSLLYW
ncbi:hypothetical protein LguiB_011524 [Lonicera macranthoides]